MRVVMCTDRIGALPSGDAGAALGRAFRAAAPGVQVAVVPLASGGADLALALEALGETAPIVLDPSADEVTSGRAGEGSEPEKPIGIDLAATSTEIGRALAAALETRPARVIVDATAVRTHDAGAGILAALGARADVPLDGGAGKLAGITSIDIAAAQEAVGDTEIVVVVPSDEVEDLLLGLRGLTSRRGREAMVDPASMLATDKALGALAGALGVVDAPGMGAAGGVATALTALGAWVTTGPALCAQIAGLERTASVADVLVTGSDQIDFGTRGGAVVESIAALGERVLRPVVVVARSVAISERELRTFGVEVAYALGGSSDLGREELTRRAAGVATSWTW